MSAWRSCTAHDDGLAANAVHGGIALSRRAWRVTSRATEFCNRWNLSGSVLPQLIRLRRFAGHSTVTALLPAQLVHSIAKCARVGFRDSLWMFFAYKKMLGRTETRTRDRMYCQTIRTVRHISRDDRARIATFRLRTPTDLRRILEYMVCCVWHVSH